ncbi:MAG: DNA repair protein RecO [Pseudomonadota bacterium]
MEWTDEALVLSRRPYGEDAVILQLLTRSQGRHAGLLRGGQGRRGMGLAQPGSAVTATWRGRLADQLGSFRCEPLGTPLGLLLDAPGPLAALNAALAVAETAFPERAPLPGAYEGLEALLEALSEGHWAEAYVVWELQLLGLLGFGLDLTACAATGVTEDLVYVSPKSGRAVSREAGAPYQDRLLSLPPFLLGQSAGGAEEVAQGLRLTAYFLERSICHPQNRSLPPARQRLSDRFAKPAAPPAGPSEGA